MFCYRSFTIKGLLIDQKDKAIQKRSYKVASNRCWTWEKREWLIFLWFCHIWITTKEKCISQHDLYLRAIRTNKLVVDVRYFRIKITYYTSMFKIFLNLSYNRYVKFIASIVTENVCLDFSSGFSRNQIIINWTQI